MRKRWRIGCGRARRRSATGKSPAYVPNGNSSCTWARAEEGSDRKVVFDRRGHALWALVSLGKNVKRFDDLPADRRDKVLAILEQESAGSPGTRQELAQKTLTYLHGNHAGSLESLGV